MGSSYEDWVRGFPNPVGLAKVPRSSETRRRDCCKDAENWSRDPPNHSFSLLLMSARLMETVPGIFYEMAMLCALRSGRVREAAALLRYRLLSGCPDALLAAPWPPPCARSRAGLARCFITCCALHARRAA